jgi:hypothetical protein
VSIEKFLTCELSYLFFIHERWAHHTNLIAAKLEQSGQSLTAPSVGGELIHISQAHLHQAHSYKKN